MADEELTAEEWKAKYEEMRKHSRDWEKKATANRAELEELKKQSDAGKSDLQKALEAAQAAQAEVEKFKAKAEKDALRAKVSAATKVPANLIVGDDEEGMTAYANGLMEFAKGVKPAAPSDPSAGKFADGAKDGDTALADFANQLFGE